MYATPSGPLLSMLPAITSNTNCQELFASSKAKKLSSLSSQLSELQNCILNYIICVWEIIGDISLLGSINRRVTYVH